MRTAASAPSSWWPTSTATDCSTSSLRTRRASTSSCRCGSDRSLKPRDGRPWASPGSLFMKLCHGAVVLVVGAHFVNMLPNSMLFARFAFGDNGWPLTVDQLLDGQLNPVTDFGYFYGLLTLLVDRAAFAMFGRTPNTVIGIYAVCTLAGAIGIARTMAAVKLRLFPAL